MREPIENRDISTGERVITVVRRLVDERAITGPFSREDTLTEVGFTSLDAVKLVLLVEDEFNIEIPLSELTLANFRSIATIS